MAPSNLLIQALLQELASGSDADLYAKHGPEGLYGASDYMPPGSSAPVIAPGPEDDRQRRIMELEQILTTPDQQPQMQLPREPHMLEKIAALLGNAGVAYGRGLNPAVGGPDFMDQLRQRRAQREGMQAEQETRRVTAEGESARGRAALERERLLGEQESERAGQEKAAEEEAELAKDERRYAREIDILERKIRGESEMAAEDRKFRSEQEAMDRKSRERIASMRDTDGEEEPSKKIAQANSIALGMRDGDPERNIPGIVQRLAAGEKMRDIFEEYEEELDRVGVYGKDRETAVSYFFAKANEAIDRSRRK